MEAEMERFNNEVEKMLKLRRALKRPQQIIKRAKERIQMAAHLERLAIEQASKMLEKMEKLNS